MLQLRYGSYIMSINLGVSVNGKPAVSKTATGGSIPSTPARYNSAPCFAKKRGKNWTADRYSLVPVAASTAWYLSNMKFYYIYILRNTSKNFIYVGYSEDLKSRIASHNKGENTSTKHYTPLELIHYEAYRNIKDAKRRELYLKSNKGRATLMTMLKEYFVELK